MKSLSIYLDKLLAAKRVVLLQGPVGSFFASLADWLETKQIECFKVNFNAGDWRYYHHRPRIWHYRNKADQFATWFSEQVLTHQIDAIVCFGDCRFYHRQASKVAKQLNIQFYAFEEGYIRPDYITFEADGVNSFSNFLSLFEHNQIVPCKTQQQPSHNHYSAMVRSSIQYYLFWALFCWLYPFYRHHRGYNPIQELYYWIVSGIRRIHNKWIEPKPFHHLIRNHNKKYFIFTLQVHNDSQVRVHSDYQDIRDCIVEVIQSFAAHAAIEHHLVFKHHPMDRGYRHYGKLIRQLAAQHHIESRVHYFCDVHLPTLLKHSLGLVTINSTTGIQALYHHIPVKTLGRSIYDLAGLTAQVCLDEFWSHPPQFDEAYFHRFRDQLIHYTQLNGAYYGTNFWMK